MQHVVPEADFAIFFYTFARMIAHFAFGNRVVPLQLQFTFGIKRKKNLFVQHSTDILVYILFGAKW